MHINHRRHKAPVALLAAVALPFATGAVSAADASTGAQHAHAVIIDATGTTVGNAKLVEDANGTLHVNVKVHGLAPGLHGIHIHARGACAPSFNDAGAHHNPLGAAHGDHAGDLPNLTVNTAGNGRLNATTHSATLSAGPISVFDHDGSAIIIHAATDDYVSQPTGNSGSRVACGVITTDT